MKKTYIKIIAALICLCAFALTSCDLGMIPEDVEISEGAITPSTAMTENKAEENNSGKGRKVDSDKMSVAAGIERFLFRILEVSASAEAGFIC